MDTTQLTSQIRTRFDHAAAKKNLKEKYEAKMTFGYNGGMFKSTPEMITFLGLYGEQRIVVKDLYDTPVEVNAQCLKDYMQSRWQEQMNAWLVEWNEMQKQR
jgi:hypothetical protein